METKGWKSFWTALWVSLLVLLPLVAGTAVLAQRQAAGRVRASESQSGVPVQLPREENHLTLLACVAGDDPAFVLLYLNADQNCIHLLAVPGQLAVPFSDREASLADCYAAAGPARCLQGLRAVLDLPEDAHYLAATPETLAELCGQGIPVILEIDPPVDEISIRRQHFYERCGFAKNPFPHVHPPYRKGFRGHPLVVMSAPGALTQETYDRFAGYLQNTVMSDCVPPLEE